MNNSLRDLLYMAFRHKTKIMSVFVVVMGVVVLYTYLVQEIYRSDAKILIRLGRENLSVDPTVSGPTLFPSRDRANEVNSELSIIKSRAIAEKVVDEIGPAAFLEKPDETANIEPISPSMKEAQQELRKVRREVREVEEKGKGLLVALDLTTPLTARERAVKTLMDNLDVSVEAKTDIIALSFDAPSRPLAQRTLELLLTRYLEEHIRVHSAQATPQFFEQQTEEFRNILDDREKKLDTFRREFGITTMERQKEVLLNQISGLEAQLSNTQANAMAAARRVTALDGSLKGRSKTLEVSRTTGVTNFAADALKEKLLDLRLRETDLAARYPETHRPLIDVRGQIEEAESTLATENETHTEVTTGVDDTYQQVQLALVNERANMEALGAQQASLQIELEKQREGLAALSSREIELQTLVREVDLAVKDYEQYRDSLQRARISSALDVDKVSNVGVVQPATLPMAPVRPNKLINLFLGLFVALFASLSFAFILDYFDDSVNTPQQVERWVGVPVLVTVSEKEFRACI
ncbi:MAG: Wzz/FepE/Etk N-terminal domain-containing protein [Candidatus Hydrogenedentes bacterium]|nr:Wzz/FepE/Etk N-terminal domain-containing protein [Candidatus Hydrogenedentota bacterium]